MRNIKKLRVILILGLGIAALAAGLAARRPADPGAVPLPAPPLRSAAAPQASAISATGATMAAVTAAQAFLSSLNSTQYAKAALVYNDPTKSHWHNLPPTMAPRPGIAFSDLTPAQRTLGINVLRAVLSPYGYQKVTDITSADNFLGTDMGIGFPTGPNAYLLAVFGTPSSTEPWAIEYGGHHLGLNVAISGRNHTMAPTLTGAYPNIYKKDGKDIFVLHDEVDRAMKLVNSLSADQRSKAIAPMQIWNFILGPGHDGQMVQPEGLKASEMSVAQKAMLVDVAAAWVNIMNEESAREKLAEITRTMNDTYFLWSGDTITRGMAYFRIQGPTVWIEYSPQTAGGFGSVSQGGGRGARGGDGRGGRGPGDRGGPPPFAGTWPPPDLDNAQFANDPNRKLDPTHVHTVYRDFTNDYGVKSAHAGH